jgi:hypothetical protein
MMTRPAVSRTRRSVLWILCLAGAAQIASAHSFKNLISPELAAAHSYSGETGSGNASPSSIAAKLTFTRVFKSSTPEFIEIVVPEDAAASTYEIRQLEEDPGATPFEVSAGLRAKMFDLAARLNNFQEQDLDVHRKIANLGEKTFRWEKGAVAHEVKFNYTLNSAATQLLQIFEGLARQQEHVELIKRRMRYDRLGINDALLQFETDLNHKLLPEPQGALPMLDQIVNDTRFVDIARQRARNLADRIRREG